MNKEIDKKQVRYQTIGWREHIALPELRVDQLTAKIDTGARTSALHATKIREFFIGNECWVEFDLPSDTASTLMRHKSPVLDERLIKNTSGKKHRRYLIRTILVMGSRQWPIELSLTDRAQMRYDLILGRTAVRSQGLLINPGRSFLAGSPQFEQSDLTKEKNH